MRNPRERSTGRHGADKILEMFPFVAIDIDSLSRWRLLFETINYLVLSLESLSIDDIYL